MSDKEQSFDSRGLRLGVFVVAYGAESQITRTLERVPESVWRVIEVLYVVDDASTDETVERVLAFDRWKEKIAVLRNRVHQRYGGNQKIGLQYAIDHGLDVVVTLHADGQFAPERLPALLEEVCAGRAEVVLGSRMMPRGEALRGGMPRYKYAGNLALTRMQNALSGLRISEFHSGFRAYRTSFLRAVPFWENSDDWHFDSQVLLQAAQAGARIAEVSIPTYYGSEIRHVNGIAYALRCLATTFAYWLHRRGVLYARNYDVSLRGRRYFEKFNDPASSHTLIWRRLQREPLAGRKILELGVGDASLTRKMHEAGAVVDGIEIDALAAELARPFCRRVLQSDLDEMAGIALDETYDILIAADVLEHLRDPEFVLSRLKRHVKVGGLLVVSLPNIANAYVRLNVLLGRFPTHSKGLLDRTHLHCYTLRTAERMLVKTGWIVAARDVTAIPFGIVFPFLARPPWVVLLKLLHGLTRVFRGLLAYQGLFYCRNPNKPHLL